MGRISAGGRWRIGEEIRVVARREGEGRRRFRNGEGGCGWEKGNRKICRVGKNRITGGSLVH